MEYEYGLIGRKLAHSDSAPIHALLGLEGYKLWELEPEELGAFMKRAAPGGFNATIPYKKSALPFMDALTEEAKSIGCVNSVRVLTDGRKIGHNTDAAGFTYMARRAGIDLSGRKALVFGSGGGALAAIYAAKQMGARAAVMISRAGEDNYENLQKHEDAEILVNATPVGMYPNETGAVADAARFPAAEAALDLVYNPRRTDFLSRAREAGLRCANGLSMLVAQAKAAEDFFLGRETAMDGAQIERVIREMETRTASVALIGMPGAGKSEIGRALARATGREMMDTDEMVARDAGKPVPEIIQSEGVASFRARERAAVMRASLSRGTIVVTGGGAVLDAANRAALRRNARVYHIRRDIALLPREGRPLSERANLFEMERARAPYYEAARDAVIDNSAAVEDAADAIWRDFCEHIGDEWTEHQSVGRARA